MPTTPHLRSAIIILHSRRAQIHKSGKRVGGCFGYGSRPWDHGHDGARDFDALAEQAHILLDFAVVVLADLLG